MAMRGWNGRKGSAASLLRRLLRHGLPLLFLALLLNSCLPTGPGSSSALAPARPPTGNEAVVSVFLQLAGQNPVGLWMEVGSVELVGESGPVSLGAGPVRFAAAEIMDGQRFAARGTVGPGRYSSLRLTINKAARERQGERRLLAVPQPVLDLPLPGEFRLEAGESRSLFLVWDEEASVRDRAFFAPVLAVLPAQPPLLADLAYVSCPDIGTIYLLRTDSNRVSGSLAIRGRPTYMTYDGARRRLYVLAAESAAIYVVDASSNRVIDRFTIPMTVNPSFLLMSSNGKWGYILDESGDHLLRMDLLQGSLDKRVRLGYKPRSMVLIPGSGQLAISSGLSQAVYLLDPETLDTLTILAAGNGPDGLLVADNHLYVAESGANTLSVYDLSRGQFSKRLNIGLKPRRLVQGDNRIYVSNYFGNTVSLLATSQQRLLREISVGGQPLEMAVSPGRKWVYVAEQATGKVAIIDQTTSRVTGHIELGAKPLHLLVVQ